jgi:hypothetical protein
MEFDDSKEALSTTERTLVITASSVVIAANRLVVQLLLEHAGLS